MPIYAYQADPGPGCDFCRRGFEKLQRLRDAPLPRCPRCGSPVRKLISAPNVAGSDQALSEKKIGQHGFTQYRKLERGVYEKTAGEGPDLITDGKKKD